MDKISFKEDSTMTWQNGKPIILHKYSISKELIDIIENENNFNTINHALHDLHVEHMMDGNKSVIVMPIQDYQTQTSVIKAFENTKNKHDRLIVLFQRLLECANEAKRQEKRSKKIKTLSTEDHEGMFYQQDGTFQKERDKNSWGLCIISDYKKDIIMSLEEELVDHKDIYKKKLPSGLEMAVAFSKFKKDLDLLCYKSYWIYSNFNTIAKHSDGSDYLVGSVGCLSVGHDPDDHCYDIESRRLRKVLRLKK